MDLAYSLKALRDDRIAQRRIEQFADSALAGWRARNGAPAIERELAAFAHGTDLAGLQRLAALFAGESQLAGFVADLVATMVAMLGHAPLAPVALRHSFDPAMASLQLAQAQSATLSLHVLDGPPPSAEPASVCLSPVETWDRVLAGNGEVELARVDRFEPDAARITRRWLQLGPGIVCRRLGTEEAPVRYFNEGALVMIRLQRRIDGDMACEYRLSDGAIVRQAVGSLHDSHLALGMTLLGRMGRRDAAVPMARLARRSGPPSLRWQALCECLGLDTVTGFALLTHIAGNGDDPLAPQAAALRAQLVETHPALAEMA